ncbi:MAG: hypothetical protein GY943_27440, partial [Chloroflexi bacterium]|nr:hypothetical protein [Chloroflexota bacterium]
GSPAYFSMSKLLSQLFGDSDAIMLLGPALLGIGIVLLPWLWQKRLGMIGALTSSILLAASPLQTIIARTASGDSTAVFALLLLLIAIFRYHETIDKRWLYAIAAAIGLGVATTPLFYGGLVSMSMAFGIHRFIGLPLFTNEESQPIEGNVRKTAVFIGIGLFIASATFFLLNPTGIGAAARQISIWIGQFNPANNPGTLVDPFLAAARYEPILLSFGLIVILWATWKNHPFASFCVYWIAAILLLILLQRGNLENALLLTLPGFLMIGVFANEILKEHVRKLSWLVAGGTLLVLMLSLVNLARYVRRYPYEPQQLSNIWIIVLAVVLGLTTLYFVLSWEITAVYQGLFLGMLAFFLFFGWGTAWWLGHNAANDPRERWITTGTDDDVRVLTPLIQDVSRQISNSTRDLDVLSSVNSPVLRWYLREIDNIQFSDTIPALSENEVIITPSTVELVLGNDYMGGDYGLIRFEPAPLETENTPLMETLRWWFFQESNAIVPEDRVVLWIRADVVSGE